MSIGKISVKLNKKQGKRFLSASKQITKQVSKNVSKKFRNKMQNAQKSIQNSVLLGKVHKIVIDDKEKNVLILFSETLPIEKDYKIRKIRR